MLVTTGDSSGRVFGPGSFAARCSLRLDFALRHLPRRRLAAPVTIVRSFVLSALNSHHNSGAAVTRSFRPLCLNSGGTPKFRERRFPKRDRQNECFGSSSYVRASVFSNRAPGAR